MRHISFWILLVKHVGAPISWSSTHSSM